MNDDVRRTAIHESGHAVASFLLGGTVLRVALYAPDEVPRANGHCSAGGLRIWPRASAVVNLAGPLAEARWVGIDPIVLLTPSGNTSAAAKDVGAGDDLRRT